MKHRLLVIILIVINNLSFGQDILEVKITPVLGFDSLIYNYRILSWSPLSANNPWKTTKVEVKGIPTEWKKYNVKQIWFDAHQFAYQNYYQGKITKKRFNELIESWDIDTTYNLSKKPIKCFIHIAIGKNKNDSIVYRIDTDNDFDFSDEQTYEPPYSINVNDSNLRKYTHWVKGEFFFKNEIVIRNIPLLVVKDKGKDRVMCNFPEHFVSKVKNTDISVTTGFSSLMFNSYNTFIKQKNKDIPLIQKGEYIVIDSNIYKNLGADYKKMTLKLKKLPADTIVYSSQIGFKAIPFTGNDIMTNKEIKLSNYKGKYIYLDFWGSWCGPCVKEIPNIKEAYDKVDKSKIEFIGIALDSEKSLKKSIEVYKIDWIQILSTKENNIVKLYNVEGYPTTILIDKNGKIIAKNIRGEKLLDKLNKYIK